MSRVGRRPVALNAGVTCTLKEGVVHVKGPKGERSVAIPGLVEVKVVDGAVHVTVEGASRQARALWGLTRNLIQNAVIGVDKAFKTVLHMTGVGYRASVQGKVLKLQLGYSHDVLFPIPDGVSITCAKPTELHIEGIDAQRVGQTVSDIQAYRPPEPYKLKGIKKEGQFLLKKEGKKK